MLREVKVPKFSSTISEATLARWIKKEGEFVKKGEPLFEISALKLNMEVESPFEGVLSKIIVSEGTSIKADDLVAWIDVVEKDESSAASAHVVSGEVATYDVAVIGGGPGGYVAAIRAAQLGARVVLVEKALLGGTCLNWGCIPTKALVKSASVYENIKRASEFGFEVREALIDFKKIMNRKDKIVAALRSGIEQLLRARKIEVVKGQGRISSADEITVYGEKETRKIKVEKGIIIATGSRPAVLPIPGIENPGVLNSDQILELVELPRSITIIGGGVIGMEYAFIFNAFGVDVTVIELMPEILPNMDVEISAALRNAALQRGIKVHASTRVSEIKRAENGGLVVAAETEGKSLLFYSEKVLVTIGRALNTEDLGLEELGIEMEKSAIKVDGQLRTNVPGIYAVGDVNGKYMLAHVASAEGIVAAENIMGTPSEMKYDFVPSAVFTRPEIGSVGLTQKAAEELGYEVKVGKFSYRASGKAVASGEVEGFVKMVVDGKTGKILGVHIIGEGASDVVHEAAVAMAAGVDVKTLARVIHAHPTLAECLMESAHAAMGEPIHTL